MNASDLVTRFEKEFQATPEIFSAPGRVNLIGEHTDYNDGFVLPSAIGFYTHAAVSPRSDRKLVLRSTEFDEPFEFDLDNLPQRCLGSWCDYMVGVPWALQQAGVRCNGANLLVHGEVPIGAGLSSSAAIEVATALALLSLSQKKIPLNEVPRLCQRAENEFVGARVGIMDQFVSCLGKEDHALLLDCRSLDFELVPIPAEVKLVVCNTMVKHELSGGEYNQRRAQCEQGVKILSEFFPGIKALRDVSTDQLSAHAAALSQVIYNRCRHVVEENQRVKESARSFGAGDLSSVGKLMHDSHRSLRDLYEVSCRELDVMVASAEGLPGFYGGRMTGGGFGGCTVNLVAASHTETFRREVARRYERETSISPEIYVCSPANGAGAGAASKGCFAASNAAEGITPSKSR
jgi:galactokinase